MSRAAIASAALVTALGLAAAAGGAACTAPDATGSSASAVTELDRVEWLEKTSQILRFGVGLGPHDDIAALSAMPREAVVDMWMQDPRFGDAVLGFNLYYLGRSMDQLHATDPNGQPTYNGDVFDFPQALASAKAVVEHGDYFTLYAESPPYVVPPNAGLAATLTPGPSPRQATVAKMDAAIAIVASDRVTACASYEQAAIEATNELRLRGFGPAARLRELWLTANPSYPLAVDCAAGSSVTADQLALAMRTVRTAIDGIWQNVEANPVKASARALADLPRVDVKADGLPALVAPLGKTFFTTLPSSSTNFHRKRAAYMLKTYFCDDLTPLSVPVTDPGDGGESTVHASNPNCKACHYRLDPMGALFRGFGANGRDFTGDRMIQFDDQVIFRGDAFDRYLSTWKDPDGSFRAGYWVLGSGGQPQLEAGWTAANGDTLAGLWSYLAQSKQVKSCLVQRLAEYVLGPDQIYDRQWLARIASSLQAGPTSGEDFKAVLKSLLLSKTFSTHDPEKGVCYDTTDDAPEHRAPCAIAGIVATQCAGCHQSVDGPGHLDFTSWIDTGNGVYSWAHTDDDGTQLSHVESVTRILGRIDETDPQKRMPLFRSLSPEDLTAFRGWLEDEARTP